MRKARWLTRRRVRKSAVNSFAVLAAAGTAAALVTVGTVAPPAASAGVARQAAPPVPVLDWHSCQGAFQCATATVPLDYRRPDGATISIAVIRHLATDSKVRPKTLFATHYHELTDLADATPGVVNFHVAVRECHRE